MNAGPDGTEGGCNVTDEEFIPDEVRPGRRSRYRFTQSPQWALLWTDLSDAGYRAYSLLLAHVNADRDDNQVWPSQDSLAAMLGKHVNSVQRVLKELDRLGLVDVEAVRYGGNKMKRRNIYTVHEEPPADWEGWASIREWYAAHKPHQAVAAAAPGPTKNGGSEPTKNGASGPTKNGGCNYTKPELDQQQQGEAPSARSAGDARRATAGSGARGARGGSAATSKSTRPKNSPKLTRAQVKAIAQVETALHQALVELLPYRQLPTSSRHLVAQQLQDRTVEQLIARVARRWEAHGYAQQVLSLEGPGARRAVGIANALVRAGECPDPSCEDGHMIDTGADCPACQERKADRRARGGKSPVPGQRTATPRWECENCGRPGKGEAPADQVCRDCRTQAENACEALRARIEAPAEPSPTTFPETPQQPAEAPRRPDTAETAPAETDDHADREELERLREQIAAAHPGLAAMAQKANH
ncbi:helix-turn-helix domain-containing protein [Streptomyces sp. KAU_LT]|uniref:helix-turn-helix domain-containing protein n=1 Tax=Streptomyces sp. KAU_LT TaxID=3046669 RepID=UPI0024B6D1FC|nr:helix-turn-helix domain-containing protein [Streptomyces sp. KAU_LT]MDI9836224.1 helix-turn-helix domain-containing protein [Streptomyces sp. KAU_LT]